MNEKIIYPLTLKARVLFDPLDVTKKHERQSKWKKIAIAEFDCDLREYYSWFIRRRYNIRLAKPLRLPHLTIINDRIEDYKKYYQAKKLYDGHEIDIYYNNNPRTQGDHWWLRCNSNDAKFIRTEAGLDAEGNFNLHLTIGRVDGRLHEIDHAQYIYSLIKKYGGDYL